MKRSIKVLALVMTAVILCLTLASCGNSLSGTYTMEVLGTGTELEFKGKKVIMTAKVAGAEVGDPVEGKYSIKDDKITFEFESDDKDAKEYSGTFDFEKGDDYIKIGTLGKFTKKDK